MKFIFHGQFLAMRHFFGLSEYHLKKRDQQIPVYFDPEVLINGHLLLCGMSGTGKSFQSNRLLTWAAMSGLEADVFDVHEEFEGLPGATACRYSQATGYGYNPLVLDTDPHTGGVQHQVDFLINLIRQVSSQFGSKQEAALRYLLTDTYAAAGIFQDNPGTWRRQRITEAQRQQIIDRRRYQELRAFYPTLDDLRSYARRKVIALTIGGDSKAVTAFDQLSRLKSRLYRLRRQRTKVISPADVEKLEAQIKTAEKRCVETYEQFVNAVDTGREIDDILKYDSVDVLTSVIQRLDILNSNGIFRANEPPFGNARVRVHQIKSLDDAQQEMFVKLRLREIFERHKRAGITDKPRHVIFVEESHKFASDDEGDILNKIAKEARKFGVFLWCAAQAPTAFPEPFLGNVGTTILTGLHSMYWQGSAKKLRISEDVLKWIRGKEAMAVKMMRGGQADPPFRNVVLPNPGNPLGRQALAYEQGL